MQKILIMTGSEASLSPQLGEQFGITVIPFYINRQEHSLKEDVDFKTSDFYQELLDINNLPSSSPPSIGDVAAAIEDALTKAEQVFLFTLSAHYSQFYSTCCLAQKQISDPSRVIIFDSKGATAYEALMAITAAKLAKSNATKEKILDVCQNFQSYAEEFIIMDTLKYLSKGGRIGKVKALMGSMLSIKPVIVHRDGLATPFAKVRTHSQGLELILKQIQEKTVSVKHSRINFLIQGILADEWVAEIERALADAYPQSQRWISRISAIPSIHYGPKSWSVAFCVEPDIENL